MLITTTTSTPMALRLCSVPITTTTLLTPGGKTLHRNQQPTNIKTESVGFLYPLFQPADATGKPTPTRPPTHHLSPLNAPVLPYYTPGQGHC